MGMVSRSNTDLMDLLCIPVIHLSNLLHTNSFQKFFFDENVYFQCNFLIRLYTVKLF